MLERLIADGLAGRFPAEEVDILNWKEMLKRAQDLQLKLRKRLNQRAARSSAAPAMAEDPKRPVASGRRKAMARVQTLSSNEGAARQARRTNDSRRLATLNSGSRLWVLRQEVAIHRCAFGIWPTNVSQMTVRNEAMRSGEGHKISQPCNATGRIAPLMARARWSASKGSFFKFPVIRMASSNLSG